MKDYLLLFRNASAEQGYLSTAQDMAEDMPKWAAWIGEIAQKGQLIFTAPVQYEATIVTNNALKEGPYKEANSVLVSGFLVCKSEDLESLEEWSKSCPILKYPNSTVEIRPLISFPLNTESA